MRKSISVITGMMLALITGAQVTLKTIVTQGPVVAGESFQVQYVLEDKEGKDADFFQPDFKHFRFVSGPHLYGGIGYNDNGPVKLKNITFTLIAPSEGRYVVPGASVKSQGQIIRSEAVTMEVISRSAAIARGIIAGKSVPSDGTYLLPGEDPNEKIRKNIFLKVQVDKKTCYVGQPVTATFKLYSRLNSRSDIIKNPGFYGFAMQDMIGLADNIATEETIDGKKFQVYTIRKVQLYPQQSGMLTIDPMEVQNKVEFAINKVLGKEQQEIVEGVLSPDEKTVEKPGFRYCESNIHTDPVTVKVNPLPETNKPDTFNGATGKFRITAALENEELAVNEEGDLLITIAGTGNFIQIIPPAVSWPQGIDGFAPEVKDSLDRQRSPLQGNRAFRFRFVSTRKGSFTIPSVSFSFFDTDSNRYRTIATKPVTVRISAAKQQQVRENHIMQAGKRSPWVLWAGTGAALLLMVSVFLLRRKRKAGGKMIESTEAGPMQATPVPSIAEFLKPATILAEADAHNFYGALRRGIWELCSELFQLSGSNMNKRNLQLVLEERHVPPADQATLLRILNVCETAMFTGADSGVDRQQLLDETRAVLRRITAS